MKATDSIRLRINTIHREAMRSGQVIASDTKFDRLGVTTRPIPGFRIS